MTKTNALAAIAILGLVTACASDVGHRGGEGGSLAGAATGGTSDAPSTGAIGSSAGVAGSAPSLGGAAGAGGIDSLGGAGAAGVGGAADTTKAGSAGSQGGGGEQGGATGQPPVVTPRMATSVPPEYGGAVQSPGQWTAKTYPVYYYTTRTTGSPSLTGSIPRQTTPITKPVNIYTPPGYDPQLEYPLLFVLHGITDNQNTWGERGRPSPRVLFDNLIAAGVIEPLIAVFPQGDSKPNFATNTSYADTAGYYLFGNELMNDLLPFIETNYSVKKDRGSRAIAGFSMGGMQTINIGLCQNLASFAWFAALHPAGGNFNSSDIAMHLERQEAKNNPIYYFYIGVGEDDGTALASAAASADALTTKSSHITPANFSFQDNLPGGHVYPTATIGLYNFVRMAFGT